jgi:phosphoribosylaminoimidazole-succinocarboxamide synthase
MTEDAMFEPTMAIEIPGLRKHVSGKVRDVYDLGSELLLVASDRISAFDVIMPNGIPSKGRVLTQLARFWFQTLRPIAVTHYITCDDDFITRAIERAGGSVSAELGRSLAGRCTLGVKADAFPVECVVRGYIAGSLWKEYLNEGGPSKSVTLHGYNFPAGLSESDKLPEPVFTPATKADSGHDENISLASAAVIVGEDTANALASISIELYKAASVMAAQQCIILADTKFEFGMHRGSLTLIDEALTPDSSRFWDADAWEPGRSQASYDKQFVRDWLERSGWNKQPPAPKLPDDVVAATSAKYLEAYQRLVGAPLG